MKAILILILSITSLNVRAEAHRCEQVFSFTYAEKALTELIALRSLIAKAHAEGDLENARVLYPSFRAAFQRAKTLGVDLSSFEKSMERKVPSNPHHQRLRDFETRVMEARKLTVEDANDTNFAVTPDSILAIAPSGKKAGVHFLMSYQVYDLRSGKALLATPIRANRSDMSLSPRGNFLISASPTEHIAIWNVRTGQMQARLQEVNHQPSPYKTKFSQAETRVATISRKEDEKTRIWDMQTGAEIVKLEDQRHKAIGVDFSPDGSRLVTWSNDGTIEIWDAQTGQRLLEKNFGAGQANEASFSFDGSLILSRSEFRVSHYVWDARSGDLVQKFEGEDFNGANLTWRPGFAQILVRKGPLTSVRLLDAKTAAPIRLYDVQVASIYNANFSHDGKLMFTTDQAKVLTVWDTDSGHPLRSFDFEGDPFLKVVASEDLSVIAGNNFFELHVWQTPQNPSSHP